MKVLGVLAAVVLFFLLVSRVRAGVWLEFGEGGLMVKLRVGTFYIRLLPGKPKEKKEKEPKSPKEKIEEGLAPKGGALDAAKKYLPLVKELLPVVADAAGQMKRRIRIDNFKLDLIWRAADPAACAVGFGGANAAVGMIWPLIEQNFNVKDHRIRTAVEFEAGSPTICVLAMVTMTIGQGVSLVLRVAFRFLRAYLRTRPPKDAGPATQTKNAQKEAV